MTKHEQHDELLEQVADAYRPPPMTGSRKARFAEGVRARIASRPPSMTLAEKARLATSVRGRIARSSRWRLVIPAGIAVAATLAVLVMVPPAGDDATSPPQFAAAPASEFGASWEEKLLFAPEWVGESSDWLDDELLPADYAAALVALES